MGRMESMAGVPVYPDIKLYGNVLLGMRIWEGDGWKEESMSWKEGCYIHSGLSGLPEMTFQGPDAQKLLSMVSINNCYKWPVGKSKHLVMCDEDGLIANHGLSVRDSEDCFRSFACFPWAVYQNMKLNYDVKITFREVFILQVAGPTSIDVLEKVIGESLRDVGFLQVRKTKIPGIEADIEVSRIGMVGNLAYELRGPIQAGPEVYDRVYQEGKAFGMKRLGWRTYVVNHAEGGFPQLNCTFTGSCYSDPEYMRQFGDTMVANISGSVDPKDLRARYRTPAEVNWDWMTKFDHEFIGRRALEAEAASPRRKLVTLRWNSEDVLDTYASLLQKEKDTYKTIELPCGQQQPAGGHADHVTKDGKKIGISSATTYSIYYREVISMCTIDVDQAELGNEVIVHWGDYGKRIKEIHATVERYPYLDLPRNQEIDTSKR